MSFQMCCSCNYCSDEVKTRDAPIPGLSTLTVLVKYLPIPAVHVRNWKVVGRSDFAEQTRAALVNKAVFLFWQTLLISI